MMNERFKALIMASGLSQSKVADHVSLRSGECCTERQVRSWIATEGKNTRPCPQWALDAMLEFETMPMAA